MAVPIKAECLNYLSLNNKFVLLNFVHTNLFIRLAVAKNTNLYFQSWVNLLASTMQYQV